jgi:hypothetical protein
VTDEAVRLDAYVEGVLAGRPAGPRPLVDSADIDPASRRAADILARSLVRFHPSFRFEDALAARLRMLGEALHEARPEVAPGPHPMLTFPINDLAPLGGGPAEPFAPVGRGLLVGGAIASGLSLAGAAYLAWRRVHRVAS